MKYSDISTILSKFTFESKMRVCQYHTTKFMEAYGLELKRDLSIPYPWEIEQFALFSVMFQEEKRIIEFSPKYLPTFYEIISCLRNYKSKTWKTIDKQLFTQTFMRLAGQTQFEYQKDFRLKLYRYDFFFSFINEKVNMKKEFIKMFEAEYKEYRQFAFLFYEFFVQKAKQLNINYNPIIIYLRRKYHHIVQNLTKEREEYIEEQNKLIGENPDGFHYGFKLFFQYPFISYQGNLYIPMPYLVINAVTDSLYFRMTANNDSLRTLIGKEVLEKYLLKLFNDTCIYDEIEPEMKYYKSKIEKLSPDVMIREGSLCAFIDSKSTVPSLKSREIDIESINKDLQISATNIVKMYKQIEAFIDGEFYPFRQHRDFSKADMFGIVVMLEDHYIRKSLILDRAREMLGLSEDSDAYRYLCSNIRIIGLYEVEKLAYRRENIFSALISSRDNPNKWFDIILNMPEKNGRRGNKGELIQIKRFDNQMIREFETILDNMIADGVVDK
jgi:hypothetical protein